MLERDQVERAVVRGLEHHRWRESRVSSLVPALEDLVHRGVIEQGREALRESDDVRALLNEPGVIDQGATAQPRRAIRLLVAAVVTMRFSDTYVTAMLYRVCARRFEAEPATQERVVLAFGQLLILGTLTAGLLGFTLVHDGAIVCRVGNELVAGGANASAAAPVLACDDFW